MSLTSTIRTLSTLMCFALLLQGRSVAGVINDVKDCYQDSHLDVQPDPPGVELFVLVDQTIRLDEHLKLEVMEQVSQFIHHGNAYTVGVFSAFAQNHYLDVVSAGFIEPDIPQKTRYKTGRRILTDFDDCMESQENDGRGAAGGAIKKALDEGSQTLAKSEILASLKEFSFRVHQSKARDKVILLVSDGLENSAVTSFYSKNTIRSINVQTEIAKAEKNGMFGDFGKARVYVVGGGLVNEGGPKDRPGSTYRNSITLNLLAQFWTEYFERSNAQLVKFGTPALDIPIQ